MSAPVFTSDASPLEAELRELADELGVELGQEFRDFADHLIDRILDEAPPQVDEFPIRLDASDVPGDLALDDEDIPAFRLPGVPELEDDLLSDTFNIGNCAMRFKPRDPGEPIARANILYLDEDGEAESMYTDEPCVRIEGGGPDFTYALLTIAPESKAKSHVNFTHLTAPELRNLADAANFVACVMEREAADASND